jgi:hypothetical protein
MKIVEAPEKINADYSGHRYNKLVVISYNSHMLNSDGTLGHVRWNCKCDCGNLTVVAGKNLRNNSVKSCGCGRRLRGAKNHKWQGHEEISLTLFNHIKTMARDRGIEFNLNIEYLWTLFLDQNRSCALTGWPIQFSPFSEQDKIRTASLDRINNNIGYVIGNVRWLHKRCNMFKHIMTDKELFELSLAIVNNNNLFDNKDLITDGSGPYSRMSDYNEY